MLLFQVAEQYALYNIYNVETKATALRSCSLFDRRSGLDHVDNLAQEHVVRFRKETLAVAKAVTYNGYLRYIKMVARWGQERGLLNAESILLLRKAPQPKAPKKTIENDDYAKLIAHMHRHPDIVTCSWFWIHVIQFLHRVGVRRRQLVEIQIQDIDWQRGILRLRYQGSKNLREWDAPLIDPVLEDLRYLFKANATTLKRDLLPTDKVFNICYFNKDCSPDPLDQTRMRPEYVTQQLKKISHRTGIRIGAHRLRHTLATRLCNPEDPNMAADLVLAQEVLGHSDISTTRDYVQPCVENRREYMQRLLFPVDVDVDGSGNH